MEESLIRVGDLHLATRRYGNPADPCVVLIRGLGTQMIEWSPRLLETLVAGGLQVVIFDNRDVGASSKLSHSYSIEDMAADVIGILDALALDRVYLLGISLGGMIAQHIAFRFPDRLRCLLSVMSSSGSRELPVAAPEVRERMTERASGREAIIALDASNRALFGSPGYPESETLRLAMATRAYDRCYYPEGVARQMEAAIADGSRVERLRQINVPTLVIHGADDPLLLPACGEDTARHIPGAEFQLVPGMGHNIPDELAPDLAQRVLEFIVRH